MPEMVLKPCLAIRRNGTPCLANAYSDNPGRLWHSTPVTQVFCWSHDQEYSGLLRLYVQARSKCKDLRSVFMCQASELNELCYRDIKIFERRCRMATKYLDAASQIRSLRFRRFAAAFDEFANDESVEHLTGFLNHSIVLLRDCLVLIRREPDGESGLTRLLHRIQALFVGTALWHIDNGLVAKSSCLDLETDLASTYYASMATHLRVIRSVQNIVLSSTIIGRKRNALEAWDYARRATLRTKLGAFLLHDQSLGIQIGSKRLKLIRAALYRRIVIEDKIMLTNLPVYRGYTPEELFSRRSTQASDLERIWSLVLLINPACLKDTLLDIDDGLHLRRLHRHSCNRSRLNKSLRSGHWDDLCAIFGDAMTFGDVYFLSTTTSEFMERMAFFTFCQSRYAALLPAGTTGRDPLLRCMRVLGLFITSWTNSIDTATLIGIMVSNDKTRTFLKAFRKSRTFELDQSDNADNADKSCFQSCGQTSRSQLEINVETLKGERVTELYTRTGITFQDEVVVRLAGPLNNSEMWKLELLQSLAFAQTGHRDVCVALDWSYDKHIPRSSKPVKRTVHDKANYHDIDRQSLLELKRHCSKLTLESLPIGRGSRETTASIFPHSRKSNTLQVAIHSAASSVVDLDSAHTAPDIGLPNTPLLEHQVGNRTCRSSRRKYKHTKFNEHFNSD